MCCLCWVIIKVYPQKVKLSSFPMSIWSSQSKLFYISYLMIDWVNIYWHLQQSNSISTWKRQATEGATQPHDLSSILLPKHKKNLGGRCAVLFYFWAYIAATSDCSPRLQILSSVIDCKVPSIVDDRPIDLPSLYHILPSKSTTRHVKWKFL